MPPISVLIKPASGKCNLRCEYCFYNDESAHRETEDFGLISLETMEKIVKEVMDKADGAASFAFQGGEPTLRGLPFYRDLMALEKKYNTKNIKVQNCLQTNGILIDEEWAQFLAENHFLTGLSLDGPKGIHDRFRHTKSGGPTYATVMKAVKNLDRYGAEYNILFTVTSELVKEPGKVYSFFKENGFKYLQFMPCIDPYYGQRGKDNFSLLPSEFSVFLKKFFDRWVADVMKDDGISVRYFDNLLSMAAGYPPESCSMRGSCSCQFVFEADGSCYPCDFYVNEQWCLGNIANCTLDELFESENAKRFLATGSAVNPECRSCSVRQICRGGCRRDRENPQHRNYYCKSYKSFLEYCWPKMRQAAMHILDRQKEAKKC